MVEEVQEVERVVGVVFLLSNSSLKVSATVVNT